MVADWSLVMLSKCLMVSYILVNLKTLNCGITYGRISGIRQEGSRWKRTLNECLSYHLSNNFLLGTVTAISNICKLNNLFSMWF